MTYIHHYSILWTCFICCLKNPLCSTQSSFPLPNTWKPLIFLSSPLLCLFQMSYGCTVFLCALLSLILLFKLSCCLYCFFFLLLNFLFCIGVQLINNAVTVSGGLERASAVPCTCIHQRHCVVLCSSVVSYSLRLHGLQPAWVLCPWDSSGKNTGAGCHSLLQGIFPTLVVQWLRTCLPRQRTQV